MIKKRKSLYEVVSKSGRSMGKYKTKNEAEKRLREVEMFKHMKGNK